MSVHASSSIIGQFSNVFRSLLILKSVNILYSFKVCTTVIVIANDCTFLIELNNMLFLTDIDGRIDKMLSDKTPPIIVFICLSD